jgi:hypothetical protein
MSNSPVGASQLLLSKERIVNLATPDNNITQLQGTQPQLYQAIKNLGTATKQITNSVFPPPPIQAYRGRIILPGVAAVANNVLAHPYHVVLPNDPSGYWTYNSITLTNVYITAKIAPSSSALSVDVLIAKNKGQTTAQSIFQSGKNPQLPTGILTTHNVMFSINQLFQDDIGSVNILAADGTTAGIEIVLVGYYNYTENQVD